MVLISSHIRAWAGVQVKADSGQDQALTCVGVSGKRVNMETMVIGRE